MKVRFLLLSFLIIQSLLLFSQEDKIDLFLDCRWGCDHAFIKSEIDYINYVHDRFDANVYVKVTSQGTASGGRKVVLFFEGDKAFIGCSDSIVFYRTAVETNDEYREKFVQRLQMGLMPFIVQTSMADHINLSVTAAECIDKVDSTKLKDKWNLWVFRIGMNGNFNKDDLSSSSWMHSSFNASRVTEKTKVKFHSYISRNNSVYQYDDEDIVINNNSYGGHLNMVTALTTHFSVGGSLSANSSTYNNYDYRIDLKPAVEYSFYPYEEATKRSLTMFYKVGPSFRSYNDTSIYNQTKELVWHQNLSVNFGMNQKWGQAYAGLGFGNYLNDFSLADSIVPGLDIRSFHIHGSVNIMIVKGLSFNLGANANFNKGYDPNIPAESFTLEELLTSSRVYKTDQSFHLRAGISYRFGSMYNNIVNPRFNSSDLF